MSSSDPIPAASHDRVRSSSSTPPPQPHPQPPRRRQQATNATAAASNEIARTAKANSSRPHTSAAQVVLPVEACSQVLGAMFDPALDAALATRSDRAMTVAGVVDARIYTPQSTNAQPMLLIRLGPMPCSQLPIPRLQSTRSTRMFINPDIIMRKLNQAAVASGQSNHPLAIPAPVSIGAAQDMPVIAHVGPPAYGASDLSHSQSYPTEPTQLPLVSFKGTVTRCLSRALGIYEIDQQILLVTFHAVANDPPSIPAMCKAFNVHVVCQVLGTSKTAPAFPICVACAYSTIEWESTPLAGPTTTNGSGSFSPAACDALLGPTISELRQLWNHVPLPLFLDFIALVLALAPFTTAPEPAAPPWLVTSGQQLPTSRLNTQLLQVMYLQLVRPTLKDQFATLKVFTRRLWASEFVEHPAHCSVLGCDSALPAFPESEFVVGRVVALSPAMLGLQMSESSVPVPLIAYAPVCPSVMGHVVCLTKAKRMSSADGASTLALVIPRRAAAEESALVPFRTTEWWIVQLLASDTHDGLEDRIQFRGRGNPVPGPQGDSQADSLPLSLHIQVTLTAFNPHVHLDWSPTLHVCDTYLVHCHRKSPPIPSDTLFPVNNPSPAWSLYLTFSAASSWPLAPLSIPPPPVGSLVRTPLSLILDGPHACGLTSRIHVAGTIRSLVHDPQTNHLLIDLVDADDLLNCISLIVSHPSFLFPIPFPAWIQPASDSLHGTPALGSRLEVADAASRLVQSWFPSLSPTALAPPSSTPKPTALPLDRVALVPATADSTPATYWKHAALATAHALRARLVARVHQIRGSITLRGPLANGQLHLTAPVPLVLTDASTSVVALAASDAELAKQLDNRLGTLVVGVQRQSDRLRRPMEVVLASYDPHVEYAVIVKRVRPDSNEVQVVDGVRVGEPSVAGVLAWSLLEALEQADERTHPEGED
ncbi:hypothetical protein BCR44DRAFT_1449316 [Catenaria anguillulae PL171]|uniref:CST complex subunit CTC1 n=1 Tax=Catenaria anguillulae PL171 TaxID=765915 RepID=A0A1Y2H4V2_9FUNG|nr:hypothetical protein BCR44DRAFT_1449316 [Catenaria anguillulae PL171]